MSPDGKPIQVNASTLQAAAAQNAVGMLDISKSDNSIFTRIVNNFERRCITIKSWSYENITIPLGHNIFALSKLDNSWSAYFSNKGSYVLLIGNTVTVMSPEGKPIQLNSSVLQAAAAQNTVGRLFLSDWKLRC